MTTSDGPQAATRYAKDRRPAYTTNAARSLAHLEQRLAILEGKKSLHQETSPPRCAAASDLDNDLHKFGEMYNEIEERLGQVEKEISYTTDVSERLEILEQRVKPYKEYEQHAQIAVQQLKRFQERFSPSVGRSADASAKLVSEHEATIREHHSRILELEDRYELAKASALSTKDLARALVQRLKRGDTLDVGTTEHLRLWLGDAPDTKRPVKAGAASASNAQMLGTPTTDDSTEARPTNVEDSIENEAPPSKRRKTTAGANSQPQASPQHPHAKSASERYSTPDLANALAVFRKGGLASADLPRPDEHDVAIPPERKSSRKSLPPKRNENMVNWKDANARMKGVRRGGGY
ncbi:hypothetical protein EJ03DRAFT_323583 [Teratosphaeria nubilosa]|uniref:Uncharacterized protein n=1 Tax=Teratosphaeria nubilosa TaxID=161662 RepID=A0A6G1LL97_9PEZI|nr:hypothetical protein EJ03DRAFT_323583 [Teratosphaeria nubilosa]